MKCNPQHPWLKISWKLMDCHCYECGQPSAINLSWLGMVEIPPLGIPHDNIAKLVTYQIDAPPGRSC